MRDLSQEMFRSEQRINSFKRSKTCVISLLWRSKVGWERFSWEGAYRPSFSCSSEYERVFVDDSEHCGCAHAHAHLGKHVHVPEEFANSRTRCTERPTGVLAIGTASRISAETNAHAVRQSDANHWQQCKDDQQIELHLLLNWSASENLSNFCDVVLVKSLTRLNNSSGICNNYMHVTFKSGKLCERFSSITVIKVGQQLVWIHTSSSGQW